MIPFFILLALADPQLGRPFDVAVYCPDGTSISVRVQVDGCSPVPPYRSPYQEMLRDWRAMQADMVDAAFHEDEDRHVTFSGRWLIDVHAWMILKTRIAFRENQAKAVEAEGGR